MSTVYRIDANGDNTLEDGSCTLDSVIVNTAGIGSTATVYDSSTATGYIVAVIDTTKPRMVQYGSGIELSALTIVTSGVAPADLTVVVN